MHSLNGKTLVLVRSGSSSRIALYQVLKAEGVRLYCVAGSTDAAFEGVFDDWFLVDMGKDIYEAKDDVLGMLASRGIKADGVYTYDDFGVQLACAISAALGLHGLDVDFVKNCQDKYLFRTFCEENGLPFVRHALIANAEDIGSVETKLSFPAVFKPRNGVGNHFARRVNTIEELRSTYDEAIRTLEVRRLRAYEWAKGEERPTFLVEELIQGHEVDVDVIVYEGKILYGTVMDNDFIERPELPYFASTATGDELPSRLSDQAKAKLLALAKDMVDVASKTSNRPVSAVLHTEMFYDSATDRAVPIEINCRVGSEVNRCLHITAWGVDIGLEAARLALGLLPSFGPHGAPKDPLCTAISEKIHPDRSGAITHQHIDTTAKGYVEHILFYKPGYTVYVPPMGFQTLGWVVCKGVDSSEARANMDALLACSKWTIDGTVIDEKGPEGAATAA